MAQELGDLTPAKQQAEMVARSLGPDKETRRHKIAANIRDAIRKRLDKGESPQSIREKTEAMLTNRLAEARDEAERAVMRQTQPEHQRIVDAAIREWEASRTTQV